MAEITNFDMNLSSILAIGESRAFTVTGGVGATFNLEIKNEDGYYYNPYTKAFQVIKSHFSGLIGKEGLIKSRVWFPLVTDNDQYDVSITATGQTKHAKYDEVRFGDGSLDINSSSGSNSLLMTKVIYQYVALTLTLVADSPNSTIATASRVDDTISISSGEGSDIQPFEISFTVAADKALQIIKQPEESDILAFISPNIGGAPISIPGENIYPTATTAFVGDDVNGAITSGVIVEIDADVAGNVVIGDKVTTPVTTATVLAEVPVEEVKVILTSVAANTMAIGDQVTGNAYLDANIVTVVALNPDGDNANEFSLSEGVAFIGDELLTFSSKVNRSLTTVVSLDPSGEAKQFTISQAVQFRDNAPLTFYNQMNYRWPIDNYAHTIKEGFTLRPGTNAVDGTIVARYSDTTTAFEGTGMEKIYVNHEIEAVETLSLKPIITNGEISTQAGAIVFNKQQPLALAGDLLKIGGFGRDEISRTYGYDIRFTDLAIALIPITTTTTSAVSNSTSVPVASRNGILDDVSTVSGIGVNANLADPTVDTGAGAVSGAGTLVLTAAQTLENGATLAFANTGLEATITGNIQILKAGTASQTLRFDIENLVSMA